MIKLIIYKKIFLKILIIYIFLFSYLTYNTNAISFTCSRCNCLYNNICYSALQIREFTDNFKKIFDINYKPSPIKYICWNCVKIYDKLMCNDPEAEFLARCEYFDGFDSDGICEITGRKWNVEGYDVNGFNKRGIHVFTKTKFNPQGYDQDGRDKAGKLILKKNMYRFVGFIKD